MPPLLPLACSAFEQYMLCDDRPAYPATAIMEFDLVGPVDPERLRRAFLDILPRHPLLTAQIEDRSLRLPRWIPGTALPRIDVAPLGTPCGAACDEGFDLRREPGTRAFIRSTGDRATLTLQVHHACSDAVGKLSVFADWLARDAALGGDDRFNELPDPHLERLAIRGAPRPPLQPPPPQSVWAPAVNQAAKFFNCRPAPLVGDPAPLAERSTASPGFLVEEIPVEEFARIRAAAKRLGLTLNDFLLTALFVALGEWSTQHQEPGDPLFRLLVPFNMRLEEELYDSACNRIGYRFLAERRSDVADWPAVARRLHNAMEMIRTQRISHFVRLLNVLGSCSLFSRLLQKKARSEKTVFATAVVSNFGDASRMYQHRFPIEGGRWRVGDILVQGIRACPPKRPRTNICIVAHGYANLLHLIARSDGRGLSADSTRRFLQHYRNVLPRLAQQMAESAPAA